MSTSGPLPGWYPDPSGSGTRWWDGRAWTSHQTAAWTPPLQQRPLPDDARLWNRWIVLQALVPVAQVLAQIPYLLSFRSLFAAQVAMMTRYPQSTTLPPAAFKALLGQFAGVLGVFGVTFGLSLLLSAAWVLLAVADMRRLERIGVVQPFHWAWSLLGIVYPIGRAVVLHRRVKDGLGPLWLLIGASVGSMVLGFVLEALVILPLLPTFASLPMSASSCGC